jgi:hypothetical protein
MASHQLAKGIASLGRHGDSMLMHVSPSEVATLRTIGNMTGNSVTTNPDTGLPEAFNLGNFFSAILPTAAGFLVGGPAGASLGLKAGTAAATLAPIAAGMATGAVVAGAKGEDVLGGALMGGLGGYGGGNLGTSLGKMGAANTASTAGTAGTASTAGGYVPGTIEGANVGLQSQTMPAFMQNSAASAVAPMSYTQSLGQMGQGAMDVLKTGGYDKFVSPEIGGSAMQLAPIGMAGLAGFQPEPYDYEADEARRKAEENKYRGPTGGLNLSPSSGLNLGMPSFATGGTINTNRGTISGGGLQDLYGANDNTLASAPLSQDGYGLGRLNSLVSAGANAKAANEYYATGGPVSFADGGDTGMNVEGIGSLNVNTGQQSGAGMDNMPGGLLGALLQSNPVFAKQLGVSQNTAPTKFPGLLGAIFKDNPELLKQIGLQGSQYAKGGYLNGQGDGMSDSIPATIEGKQPARLADGEFVVPADVVSHLGNGSSKAGSKRLYAMLDKVRHARTGNKKQGRQINPNKYMPA